jgi:hypothetical protein
MGNADVESQARDDVHSWNRDIFTPDEKYKKLLVHAFKHTIGCDIWKDSFDMVSVDGTLSNGESYDLSCVTLYELKATNNIKLSSDFKGHTFSVESHQQHAGEHIDSANYKFLFVNNANNNKLLMTWDELVPRIKKISNSKVRQLKTVSMSIDTNVLDFDVPLGTPMETLDPRETNMYQSSLKFNDIAIGNNSKIAKHAIEIITEKYGERIDAPTSEQRLILKKVFSLKGHDGITDNRDFDMVLFPSSPDYAMEYLLKHFDDLKFCKIKGTGKKNYRSFSAFLVSIPDNQEATAKRLGDNFLFCLVNTTHGQLSEVTFNEIEAITDYIHTRKQITLT